MEVGSNPKSDMKDINSTWYIGILFSLKEEDPVIR